MLPTGGYGTQLAPSLGRKLSVASHDRVIADAPPALGCHYFEGVMTRSSRASRGTQFGLSAERLNRDTAGIPAPGLVPYRHRGLAAHLAPKHLQDRQPGKVDSEGWRDAMTAFWRYRCAITPKG